MLILRRLSAAALLCMLFALALTPALAAAETFEVDSVGDANQPFKCVTPGSGECTLRSAISVANLDATPDAITFAKPLFNGLPGAPELAPATALPEITQPVEIDGSGCSVVPYDKPCLSIAAPAGTAGLTVGSPEVTIRGVAFGGGDAGIEVLGGSTGFEATGDWFGLDLGPFPSAIAGPGIFLGPGADAATIGGADPVDRNVFTNAPIGLEIEGASLTKVIGNYIGVDPTGVVAADLETAGVRIVDSTSLAAEFNEVGGKLGAPDFATDECVGPCNVIATEAGSGVDLGGAEGETAVAASGPTTIRGNYLGLGADGKTLVAHNTYGVFAAPAEAGCSSGPGQVTVGGPEPGEANFFESGLEGIYAEGASRFSAIGNVFGIAPDGSASESPEGIAIGLCNGGATQAARVEANVMSLGTQVFGIESDDGRAQIVGNTIEGGASGIIARDSNGDGNLIEANEVSGAEVAGILLESDSNEVLGNKVTDSLFGIEVLEADGNRIGGDAAGQANTLIDNGKSGEPISGAILIFGPATGRNEVAANTGFGNESDFIQLLGPAGEVPNEIAPPILATAGLAKAGGSAEPGATVRVFSKASVEAGELAELLAVVSADKTTGAWEATYAKQAPGALVAATQTSKAFTPEAGTSEVSPAYVVSKSAQEDREEKEAAEKAAKERQEKEAQEQREREAKEKEGGSGGGSTGTGSTNPAPAPTSPAPPAPAPVSPKVKITAGPKRNGTATTARLRFRAEPSAGARFESKLDGAKWAKCASPKTYKHLKPGRHTFRVRATAGGLTGAVTKYQFTVKS
jgi:Periplasmic copper-binding protein (NosD)